MTNSAKLAPTLPKLQSDWATAKHKSAGWPLFLESVRLAGIRGWSGQQVEFRFPVVAIAGENGSGKSTVLKAAAAAYGSAGSPLRQVFSPDDFFPSTPWEDVSGVVLEYRIRQGDDLSQYSLRKRTTRWRGMPERPTRSVQFLDISRTQPVDTLIGYGRLAREQIASSSESTTLNETSRGVLSRILRRTYESGEIVRDQAKGVGVVTVGGVKYSNFHQGAGEDATTDLVALLQEVPRNSLIIIDEVESSLHPRSQRRLVTELVGIAQERRLQLVMSTHSTYVLEQLPAEARIYVQADRSGEKQVLYGIAPDYALTMMDDELHPELTVYCEDAQSQDVIEALIRHENADLLKRVRLVSVGPAEAVRSLGRLLAADRLPDPGISVLDGDQPPAPGCVVLPGGASPEAAAFRGLTDVDWETVAQRIGFAAGSVRDAAEDAMQLADAHTWPSRMAIQLHEALRPSSIWEAVLSVWMRDALRAEDRASFVGSLTSSLGPVG